MEDNFDARKDAYVAFMDEFMNESDRACIILASAEIEHRLQLLFEKVLHTNAKLRRDLFGYRGALGGFSTRAKLAYALGLIDKQFFDYLEEFRAIRNKIVHDGAGASLEDASLVASTEKILQSFRISRKFATWANEHGHLTLKQIEFRYALSFMILMLEYATQEATKIQVRTQSCNPETYILQAEQDVPPTA